MRRQDTIGHVPSERTGEPRVTQPDTLSANKALVRRYIEEANNGGNVALIDELVAPDYVWHDGPASRDDLKQFLLWQRRTAPDWRISIEDILAERDRVAVRAVARGTRTEEYPGAPFPQPRAMEVTWIAIYRIGAGRISEVWVVRDFERRSRSSWPVCCTM